jgi:hypothetical protein
MKPREDAWTESWPRWNAVRWAGRLKADGLRAANAAT